METKKNEKASWTKRVLERLNLSEEGQVDIFGRLTEKNYSKAIKDRKLQIARKTDLFNDMAERDNEILQELQVDLIGISITVDPKELTSVALRDSCFTRFDRNLSEALKKVNDKENEITCKKESFDAEIKVIQDQINIFEKKLSYLEEK